MVGAYSRRSRKKIINDSPADLTETAKRLAGDSAGFTYCGRNMRNMDPLYMLTTSFTNNFDAIANERAGQLAGESKVHSEPAVTDSEKQNAASADALRRKHDSPEYVHSTGELQNMEFADRFAAYAFRGGKLAASIMAGQGKQMFTLCLARAIGRPMPQGERQKKLLGQSDTEIPVPERDTKVRFNRDAHSAVGIVTDALKSSGRLLEIFRELAAENNHSARNPLEFRNIDTIKQTLPFFDTESDKRLIKQYKSRLVQLEGDSSPQARGSARLLSSALIKQNAVLKKKQQEQRDFLTMLDRITGNVREAEKLFRSDGFAETAAQEAEELSADVPPDDDSNIRRFAENIAGAVGDFFTEARGVDDSGTDKQADAFSGEKPAEGEEADRDTR